MSLHHHPAQCERKVGSLRWSLLTICLTRAGIGPWRGSWAGRSRSPLGGQAGRPAAGKGPLCRLCVGLPPRVVSPVRVGQSGAGRPGGGVGRASGDPFAVLPPRPVRAMRGPSGGAGRRPGVAAGRCCRLLWPCRGDCASGAVRAPGSRRIELRQNRCRGGRPGRGGRGIAVPSPAAVGPGRPGRCRVPGAECRVPGAGCRVPGAGCRVPGADAACRVLRAGPAGRDPEEGASRHDGRTSRAGEVGGFAGGGGMMAATTTRPHRSRPVLAPGFLRGPECQLADPTRSRAGGSPPTTSAVPSATSTREPRRSTGLVPWIDRSVPGFSVRPGFSVLARPTGTASTSRFGPSSRCPAVRAVTLAHRLRPCGASGPAGHAGRATRPGTERPIRQYSRRPFRRMAYL